MNKTLKIEVKKGKLYNLSSENFKDTVSTLEDGDYFLKIYRENYSPNFNRKVFAAIDFIAKETGNTKDSIIQSVKKDVYLPLISGLNAQDYIDDEKLPDSTFLESIQKIELVSFSWLTDKGWEKLYKSIRLWAYYNLEIYIE